MVPERIFCDNLFLAEKYCQQLQGDIVECGVWKGGMIAGLSFLLGTQKKYYLFDSFEGLPDAQTIDGEEASTWQKNTTSSNYFDNCTADISFSQAIMNKTGAPYEIKKGWFEDTLIPFSKSYQGEICLLRLDGDWYESTLIVLETLYPKVMKGGLIIIDDYHTWTGCSRAVHHYLDKISSSSQISESKNGVAYIIKKG